MNCLIEAAKKGRHVCKIAAERQRINARLVEAGKLIQLSEAQLSVMASRVGELEAQKNDQSRAIEQRHETLAAA